MFREGDIVKRGPHKVNQPVPTFQALSQASRFDEGSVEIVSSHDVYPQRIVPTTYDTSVDPSHRDADWAGLVSKENHKRHTTDHRSQQSGIVQSEHGLISANESNDWLRKRRENIEHSTAGNSGLISGIGGSEEDRWKTNSQRMQAIEPTSRDQMTRDRRALPKRAMADTGRANSGRMTLSDGSTGPGVLQSMNSMREQPLGAGGCVGRNGSMLSNIGSAIVRRLPSEDSVRLESKGLPAAPRPRPY